MHPDGAPDREHEPARFGQWVEIACLAGDVSCKPVLALALGFGPGACAATALFIHTCKHVYVTPVTDL